MMNWKNVAKANLAAVALVLGLAGATPTAVQVEVLSKYRGWGPSELATGAFPHPQTGKVKDGWEDVAAELRALLGDAEYAAVARSVRNAHYTSPEVVRAVWDGLAAMGFGEGRVLEPGCGAGNFLAAAPPGVKPVGIEREPIAAACAAARFPAAEISCADFVSWSAGDWTFDAAVGNPPFAADKILADKRYAGLGLSLHDYFIAKALDKVRPGGVAAFVTSRYTLDKKNPRARRYFAEVAELVGAVRLPDSAFREYAGTEVVTDVLFFRRRLPDELEQGAIDRCAGWTETKQVSIAGHPIEVNAWLAGHPECVLGHYSMDGKMYGGGAQLTVKAGDRDWLADLSAYVSGLPRVFAPASPSSAMRVPAPAHLKNGAYYLAGDSLCVSEWGVEVAVQVRQGNRGQGMYASHAAVLRDWLPVRDAVQRVLAAQLNAACEADLPEAQAALHAAYDAFVHRHGPLNKEKRSARLDKKSGEVVETVSLVNFNPVKADPDAWLVASIEEYDAVSGKAKKRAIFSERVINPDVTPRIESPRDALNVCLSRLGKVDLGVVAELAGVPQADLPERLRGVVFFDPESGAYVTEDDYLSGDVRAKLSAAVSAGLDDNAAALRAVIPADLTPGQVTPRLGVPWVDNADVEAFCLEVMGVRAGIAHAATQYKSVWAVIKPKEAKKIPALVSDWGTQRMDGLDLLDIGLNRKRVRVMDYWEEDGVLKSELNVQETQAAQSKLDKIEEAFSRWLWSDAERTERLMRRYNDVYNNRVPRRFHGGHLELPGISSAYTPREHQKQVAWRIIQRGNTYMAHGVGAGKTIAMVISAMEMRRLGIVKKPMFVVPNHMLKQFSTEFLALYPAARILVAEKDKFSKDSRERFMGEVAAESWDAVIIKHSSFRHIPLSMEFQRGYVEEMIQDIDRAIMDAKNDDDNPTRKQLQGHRDRLEQRLLKISVAADADTGVSFEESGIDFLFVDEAHVFRKLDFVTNQGSIKGIDPEGSGLAWDLYMKSRYLESIRPGRSMVLASGTPVTNTLAELFTIQRYLQLPALRKGLIADFDSWSAMFGETVTTLELQPTGKWEPVTRFARFSNVADLMRMFLEVADVVKVADLPYMREHLPTLKDGRMTVVECVETPVMRAYKRVLAERVTAIRSRRKPPAKGDDILLAVITDGRKSAIDMRLIDGRFGENNPGSKLNRMIETVLRKWHEGREGRTVQMVFSDIGVPTGTGAFSVYEYAREQLIAGGVPAAEIAFMQDYQTDDKKFKLFAKLRAGRVRVLLGSTATMGTGVNAQERLAALHHLDAPWLPADVEQRNGRILRQGNRNRVVEIFAYVTAGSYDATMWQILETKQRFIDQVMRGDLSVREMDDVSPADEMAVAKAIASGSPLAMEKAGLGGSLRLLELAASAHVDEQHAMRRGLNQCQSAISKLQAEAERVAIDLAERTDGGVTFADGRNFKTKKALHAAVAAELDMGVALLAGKLSAGDRDELLMGLRVAGLPCKLHVYKPYNLAAEPEVTILIGRCRLEVDLRGWKSGAGAVERSLEAVGTLDGLAAEFATEIARQEDRAAQYRARIGTPFERAEELASVRRRLAEVDALLAKEGIAADTPPLFAEWDACVGCAACAVSDCGLLELVGWATL